MKACTVVAAWVVDCHIAVTCMGMWVRMGVSSFPPSLQQQSKHFQGDDDGF